MNIYGKGESILGEAEYHIRRPMPGTTAGASPTPQHGGRRGWWGQARLVGAGEANGGRKPPASCPSLRPNATGPNPVPTPSVYLTIWNGLEIRVDLLDVSISTYVVPNYRGLGPEPGNGRSVLVPVLPSTNLLLLQPPLWTAIE